MSPGVICKSLLGKAHTVMAEGGVAASVITSYSIHYTKLYDCEARGELPEHLWKMLVKRHFRGSVKPPFNDSARATAGLSRSFYAGVA